jgi:hypothetical protein
MRDDDSLINRLKIDAEIGARLIKSFDDISGVTEDEQVDMISIILNRFGFSHSSSVGDVG